MSKEALVWASSQKIADLTLRSVLRALAYFADKGTSECCKSQAVIAAEVGTSDRTVRACLAVLETLELISRRRRSHGFKGRITDAITLSTDRNFDVSKAAVIKIRKAMAYDPQPEKSSGNKKGRNRKNLPLQPEKSSGHINTDNTDSLAACLTPPPLYGRGGTDTYAREHHPHAGDQDNVVALRPRGVR